MINIQTSSKQVSTISDQVLTDRLSSAEDLTAAFSALQSLNRKIDTLHNNHQEFRKESSRYFTIARIRHKQS